MNLLTPIKKSNSIRLSVFGLPPTNIGEAFRASLKTLSGIQTARIDTRRNIAFVQWDKDAALSKKDILSAIFESGFAAEELN